MQLRYISGPAPLRGDGSHVQLGSCADSAGGSRLQVNRLHDGMCLPEEVDVQDATGRGEHLVSKSDVMAKLNSHSARLGSNQHQLAHATDCRTYLPSLTLRRAVKQTIKAGTDQGDQFESLLQQVAALRARVESGSTTKRRGSGAPQNLALQEQVEVLRRMLAAELTPMREDLQELTRKVSGQQI